MSSDPKIDQDQWDTKETKELRLKLDLMEFKVTPKMVQEFGKWVGHVWSDYYDPREIVDQFGSEVVAWRKLKLPPIYPRWRKYGSFLLLLGVQFYSNPGQLQAGCLPSLPRHCHDRLCLLDQAVHIYYFPNISLFSQLWVKRI